jgi:TatD DNase family protein
MTETKPYVNIHCHGNAHGDDEVRVHNLFAGGALPVEAPPKFCSVGIHPWFIETTDFAVAFEQIRSVAPHQHCLAVGEVGLDRVRGPGLEKQKQVMESQLDLAEALGLPVIVHCVRAYSDLLQLHKERTAQLPWVLHGFHGSPEIAEQCVSKGMYLSLGPSVLAQPDRTRKLLESLPLDRLFLETDEQTAAVAEIYEAICAVTRIEEAALRERVAENFERVFGVSP